MKSVWSRCLQMSLCAAAVCAMGAVHAQTAPPAAPAEQAASPAKTTSPATVHKKPQHKRQHTHQKTHPHQHPAKKTELHHHQHDAKTAAPQPAPVVYPDGHMHEPGKEHAGPHAGDPELDQYQRNALARCAVFRSEEDRRSCAARVRAAPASGSVEGGGVLREYTEQVIVPTEKLEHP